MAGTFTRDGWSLAFSPLQASGSQVENDYAPRVTVSQKERLSGQNWGSVDTKILVSGRQRVPHPTMHSILHPQGQGVI